MRKILLVLVVFTLFGCSVSTQNSKSKDENTIVFNYQDMLGNWVVDETSNEWSIFYPELIFIEDSLLIIPTRADTIIHCDITLRKDSLYLYLRHFNSQLIGKSKIIELTSSSLKLSNLLSEDKEILYNKK